MQNFCQIAENFRGTMLDVKSGLRNESDWSKKINKLSRTFLNPGGKLARGAKIQKRRKIVQI